MISLQLMMWMIGQGIAITGIIIGTFRWIQSDYKRITTEIWSELKLIIRDVDSYKLSSAEKFVTSMQLRDFDEKVTNHLVRIEDRLERIFGDRR